MERATFFPDVRRLTVTFSDPNATESSSEESSNRPTSRRKVVVKRHVDDHLPKASRTGQSARRFRGVRKRPWGKWGVEIRDPNLHVRRWLGTYDTAEAAAAVYDKEAIALHGENAKTNFPIETYVELVCSPRVVEGEPETTTDGDPMPMIFYGCTVIGDDLYYMPTKKLHFADLEEFIHFFEST